VAKRESLLETRPGLGPGRKPDDTWGNGIARKGGFWFPEEKRQASANGNN